MKNALKICNICESENCRPIPSKQHLHPMSFDVYQVFKAKELAKIITLNISADSDKAFI